MDDLFALLEPGIHEFEIHSAHAEQSVVGHRIARLVAVVTSGPDAGRMAYLSLVLSEDNEETVAGQLSAVGITPAWVKASGATWNEVVAELPGRRFRAEVRYREWPEGSRRFRNDFGSWEPATPRQAAAG